MSGTRNRRILILAPIVLVLGFGGYFGYPLARLALGLSHQGFFDSAQQRQYQATTASNLHALYTGLMAYHEFAGQFPKSSQWMDAIKGRIQTGDMSDAEAAKKLVDPALAGKAGAYGYAMNDAASEKYKDDLKDKKAPLIFMSSDTSYNAHGDPKALAPNPPRPGGNYAIAVDGTIVKM